jgi:hypothetical protein
VEWLTVACPCGVVFERWVTAMEAAIDLLLADLRARGGTERPLAAVYVGGPRREVNFLSQNTLGYGWSATSRQRLWRKRTDFSDRQPSREPFVEHSHFH